MQYAPENTVDDDTLNFSVDGATVTFTFDTVVLSIGDDDDAYVYGGTTDVA